MGSIVCHIRFTEKELSHGIDAYLNRGEFVPTSLNQLVRDLTTVGLKTILGNLYQDTQPSINSQACLYKITKQLKGNKKPFQQIINEQQGISLNKQQIEPITQITSSTINTVDFSKEFDIPYLALLQHLSDVDRQKGTFMLKAMMIPDGMTIIKALTNPETRDDDTTRRIAFEMFSHCDTLTKEEQEAIDSYNGKE